MNKLDQNLQALCPTARMPIASSPLRLPYGMVEPVVDFRFGRGLLPLLERFTLEARAFPFLVRRVRMRTFRQSRPDRRGSSGRFCC